MDISVLAKPRFYCLSFKSSWVNLVRTSIYMIRCNKSLKSRRQIVETCLGRYSPSTRKRIQRFPDPWITRLELQEFDLVVRTIPAGRKAVPLGMTRTGGRICQTRTLSFSPLSGVCSVSGGARLSGFPACSYFTEAKKLLKSLQQCLGLEFSVVDDTSSPSQMLQ